MSYELKGTVLLVHPAQTFGSGFTKREFVVKELEGKYPQEIKLEAVKDDCAKLDSYRIGDEITVSFNIRGNEHNGRHYVSLQAWKYDKGQSAPARKTSQNGTPPPKDDPKEEFQEDDDIPF